MSTALPRAGKPLSKWLVGHKMGKAKSLDEDRAVFVVSCAVHIHRWRSCRVLLHSACAAKHLQHHLGLQKQCVLTIECLLPVAA